MHALVTAVLVEAGAALEPAGGDRDELLRELRERLAPFYVLVSRKDWKDLDHIWSSLDDARRATLRREVDELLFLWMVGVEAAFRSPEQARTHAGREALRLALDVCDRALSFAESRGPWQSLRDRIAAFRTRKAARLQHALERKGTL